VSEEIQYKGKYICVKIDDELRQLIQDAKGKVSLSDVVREAMVQVLKNIDSYPELKVRLLYRYLMRQYVIIKRLRRIAFISQLLDGEIEAYKRRFEDKADWFEVFGKRTKDLLNEVEKLINDLVNDLYWKEISKQEGGENVSEQST